MRWSTRCLRLDRLVAAAVLVAVAIVLVLITVGHSFTTTTGGGDETVSRVETEAGSVLDVEVGAPLAEPTAGSNPSRKAPVLSSDQLERLARAEPPLPPSPHRPRYHNPYLPLEQSSRVCGSDGAHAQGRWLKYGAEVPPPYPAMGEILGCCQNGFEQRKKNGTPYSYEEGLTYRAETQYYWKSDACDLIPWSEERFCKALRGRDIMFAGDSLNDHWHASLYYLLGGRRDIYRKEGTIRGKKACATHPICSKYTKDGKPLKLYFLTNQLLEEERRLNRNYKWWKHIAAYPILVLNSGSWMRDPANEDRIVTDEEYRRHMTKALAIVRRQGFNGTLIWRTTYQGHPYCWKYREPLTQELTEEDFPKVAPYLRYRWGAIPGRNNFSTALFREAGAHILDVTRITNLMPLGHLSVNHPKYAVRNVTDCLHYCSPGPVYETWSMLLMNLLLGNLDS